MMRSNTELDETPAGVKLTVRIDPWLLRDLKFSPLGDMCTTPTDPLGNIGDRAVKSSAYNSNR